MARHYIIQDWQNAAEYSGEMIGRRLARSQEIFLPNGKANIALFADEEPKTKKRKSVADSIDLSERHFSRMERMSQELDEEYLAGEIDDERYELLRYKMDERLAKAWKRLEKDSLPIWQKLEEKQLTMAENVAIVQHTPESKEESSLSQWKKADKSLLTGEGWGSMALRDCKDSNVFLIGYCAILKLVKKFKGE